MTTRKQQLFLADGVPFKWDVPVYRWGVKQHLEKESEIEKFTFNEEGCEIVGYASPSDWTLRSNGKPTWGDFESLDLYSTPRATIRQVIKDAQDQIDALEEVLQLAKKKYIRLYEALSKCLEHELQTLNNEKNKEG